MSHHASRAAGPVVAPTPTIPENPPAATRRAGTSVPTDADAERIRLYGAQTGNCRRAAIALEEAGIPYQAIQVDLRRNEHKSAGFLKLNARGLVPVMVMERGAETSFTLTQSNAIMLYAAGRAPERLAAGSGPSAHVLLDRLFYFVTEVISYSGSAFALKAAGEDCSAMFLSCRAIEALRQAEGFLSETEYMAGDMFSLADIAAYTSAFASREELDWAKLPLLRTWYEKVAARPGVLHGMAAF